MKALENSVPFLYHVCMTPEQAVSHSFSELTQYGALGVLVILLIFGLLVMFRYLQQVHKEHREDRQRWLQTTEKREERTLTAYEHCTSVMSRLETKLDGVIGRGSN